MHDPVQSVDYRGEWFEIYNNTSDTVNLNGLILQDNGGEQITVSGTVNVASGDYIVLGARTNQSQNGGADVDYQYFVRTSVSTLPIPSSCPMVAQRLILYHGPQVQPIQPLQGVLSISELFLSF